MSRTGSNKSVESTVAEAEERRIATARSLRNRRLAIGAGVAILLVGAVVFLATRPPPAALANVETFPDQGQAHLSPTDPAPIYNSEPPTSGPHSSGWEPCGIFREAPAVISLVHNLEHGVVVIYYDPETALDTIADLEAFARDAPSHVIVTPREGMPSPITLTAWTHLLRLDSFDREAIEVFYGEYAQAGPERGVGCPQEVDQSEG